MNATSLKDVKASFNFFSFIKIIIPTCSHTRRIKLRSVKFLQDLPSDHLQLEYITILL